MAKPVSLDGNVVVAVVVVVDGVVVPGQDFVVVVNVAHETRLARTMS